MSKSAITLKKEIERKAYFQTPLGVAERTLARFYDDVNLKRIKVTDEDAGIIDKWRGEGGEKIEKYTKEQNAKIKKLQDERQAIIDESAKKVDEMLLEQMTREIDFISKYR